MNSMNNKTTELRTPIISNDENMILQVENDEEVFSFHQSDKPKEERLDRIIGILQEILLDSEFTILQKEFCQKNCENFEETEENKFIYTALFEQYTDLIERYIQNQMKLKIQDFKMDELLEILQQNQDEITNDILDTLMACGDFNEFKSMMLAYKKQADLKIELKGDKIQTAQQ